MSRIFYGLSGEGRGHATRVRALVERLREVHDITLFTYGDAYDLLAPLYAGSTVKVKRIPGLRFRYRDGRMAFAATARGGFCYLTRELRPLVDSLTEKIRRDRPDLVITDFEPSLPRAASRCGTPLVSLDHQHALVVNDFSSLPCRLRWAGDGLGSFVRAFCKGAVRTIVSSFYAPPVKPSYLKKAVQVGVLLRPEVAAARPERGGHLVAYLRRFAPDGLLTALKNAGIPVRVYGLGSRPSDGPLTFRAVSETSFLHDLASSEALVCTAGNQLVGEALHLGKPVFAIPERGNLEQAINAHFLKASGAGDAVPPQRVRTGDLWRFLDRLGAFRDAIGPGRQDGTLRAMEALAPYLT